MKGRTRHPYPTWLHTRRLVTEGRFEGEVKTAVESRRRLADIDRYLSPQEVFSLSCRGKTWPYKRDKAFYVKRDRGLVSLLYLSGLRINEVLRIKKSQFSYEDPDFVVIEDVKISKRKKRTIQTEGIPVIDVPLPLAVEDRGGEFQLGYFTEVILSYVDVAEEDLFKISTARAWAIVKHMTGKWCHYFRSQRISHLINKLRSDVITAKIVGIKSPATISHYYKGEWRAHRDELRD